MIEELDDDSKNSVSNNTEVAANKIPIQNSSGTPVHPAVDSFKHSL